MNNLERRIERLEERVGTKPASHEILITNVDFSDGHEDPYTVKLFSGLWAHAIGGGPFTSEEIHKLREEYCEQENRNEPEAES